MSAALSVKKLTVRYGAIEAVRSLDIDVPEGSVVALLGANGAGKTSTLRAITGLTPAASGQVFLYGKDITNADAERIAEMGVAHAPEGRQIFGDLTVEENLRIGAYTLKGRAALEEGLARCRRYFPRLGERMRQISYTLSGGELQMLAIARALMMRPRLLLLDEPSLGLAPLVVRDIFAIIREIRNEGVTVLLVEQNAAQTLKIADYGYVLEVGSLRASGPAESLARDGSLMAAYLGKQ